jgi:hypothetical protein
MSILELFAWSQRRPMIFIDRSLPGSDEGKLRRFP